VEDIKAYIESGILELYVLGDLSPEERLQVEEMATKHPAVKAELGEIEQSMEWYASENAVEPAEHLRNKILNSLVTNFGDDSIFPTKKEPVRDNVVIMPVRQNNFYKYAFAACLALLIASIAVLISVYGKLQSANTQLLALNGQNQQYAKTVNFMDDELDVYHDKSFKIITLKGTPKHDNASMLVAFSPVKKKVMIDIADLKLPQNDKEHQYQLWAIVDKKPVSLGVFDKTSADTAIMKEMQPVSAPQAFAVTLEPRGGSINPTMDEMMVIGNF
jgi:anti-sigma-K factor RskA